MDDGTAASWSRSVYSSPNTENSSRWSDEFVMVIMHTCMLELSSERKAFRDRRLLGSRVTVVPPSEARPFDPTLVAGEAAGTRLITLDSWLDQIGTAFTC
jgi:hypothetical protein